MKAKQFGLAAVLALCAAVASAVEITVGSVKQRWPWNDKVDVAYNISGAIPKAAVGRIVITAVIEGKEYAVYDSGIVNEGVFSGSHVYTWENAPEGVKSGNCTMTATFEWEPVPEGDDYMVVNLVDGSVEYEGLFSNETEVAGVSGQELSNARYNVDKYKTTHMAFRKVPKGTYKATRGTSAFTEWTTDKDYYIALFCWTNAQYGYVIKNTDGTDATPWSNYELRGRNWKIIDTRGNTANNSTPTVYANAEAAIAAKTWQPLSLLNAKTGMTFDIPTELMHEIACRAGTETTYFWGADLSTARMYAVYSGDILADTGTGSAACVGMKRPNAWGLYDMVGNQWQWCKTYRGEGVPSDIFTPGSGGSSNLWKVRGQHMGADGTGMACTSVSQAYVIKTGTNSAASYGFRAAYIVPNAEEPNAE